MEKKQSENSEFENMFNGWFNSTTKMWQTVAGMNGVQGSAGGKAGQSGGDVNFFEAWTPAVNAWQEMAKGLNKPDRMSAFMNGGTFDGEGYQNVMKTAWDSLAQIRNSFNDKSKYLDTVFEVVTGNHPAKGLFDIFNNIYENELSKFFSVPKVGLTRIHREKLTAFMDKLGVCMLVISEFYYLLATPFEKTHRNIQENFSSFFDANNAPEGFEDYYKIWIEELEKNFQSMFKTTEYTKVLSNVIDAVGDFDTARREILKDVMKFHGIPAESDMDELYNDLYALKKKVRQAEKKIAGMEEEKSQNAK